MYSSSAIYFETLVEDAVKLESMTIAYLSLSLDDNFFYQALVSLQIHVVHIAQSHPGKMLEMNMGRKAEDLQGEVYL